MKVTREEAVAAMEVVKQWCKEDKYFPICEGCPISPKCFQYEQPCRPSGWKILEDYEEE